MQSWDDYQRTKRRTDDAFGVLEVIGDDPRATRTLLTVKAVGLAGSGTPTTGAARQSEALDEALAKAVREAWPQLAARAAAILNADRDAACLACKAELEAALAKIRDLEQGDAA